MSKRLALFSTISVSASVVFGLVGLPMALYGALVGLTASTIVALLVGAWPLAREVERGERGWLRFAMRAHIVLHLAPLGYALALLWGGASISTDRLFIAPLLAFFLSGRMTWRVAHRRFGRRLYGVFRVGNTALMLWVLALFGLSYFWAAPLLSRVLLAYLSIHLLILGTVCTKIEEDVRGDGQEAARDRRSLPDALRNFVTKNIFSSVSGYTFGRWLSTLRQNNFGVSLRYWPRAFFVTLNAIINSLLKRKDDALLRAAITNVEVESPVFILGHWRSGTTHLHNMLSKDPAFSAPDFVQVTQPFGFLANGEKVRGSKLIKLMTPKTRLIDAMRAGMDAPMEDEVALTAISGLSPVHGFVFPRRVAEHDKYLTFKNATTEERERWKEALAFFAKKMTLDKGGRLLFKSPPHTCRIEMILEVFPDAKFIHIHRDPYQVFQSYKKAAKTMQQLIQLQVPDNSAFEERILRQYLEMYDAFREQLPLIPVGNYTEIAFDQLDSDPLVVLERIYRELSLGRFDESKPFFERYLRSIESYKKTTHSALPTSERHTIYQRWKRYFDLWGYAR